MTTLVRSLWECPPFRSLLIWTAMYPQNWSPDPQGPKSHLCHFAQLGPFSHVPLISLEAKFLMRKLEPGHFSEGLLSGFSDDKCKTRGPFCKGSVNLLQPLCLPPSPAPQPHKVAHRYPPRSQPPLLFACPSLSPPGFQQHQNGWKALFLQN